MKVISRLIAAAVTIIGISGSLLAAEYPTAPIKIVVPYPAGGTADIFARMVGEKLTKMWGQPVIVEGRPGAGGNIGSNLVAKATANGYTLLLGTSGSNAVNPSLYKNMPYDAWKEMILVAPVAVTVNVLVVGANHPAKSVKDILAAAKAKPGTVTFGSSGNGSVLHLSGVMLAKSAGVDMVHVPYKGTPPALLDILAGRVDMMVANAPSVMADVRAGKLRALAVTTDKRMKTLPDVPTMIEAGVPGYDLGSWFGVMAPAKTPPEIVQKLNSAIQTAIHDPNMQERFESMGSEPKFLDAAESQKFFLAELKKWGDLVKTSGAKVD